MIVVSSQIFPSVWSWQIVTTMGELIKSCRIHSFIVSNVSLLLHLLCFLFFNTGVIRKVRHAVTDVVRSDLSSHWRRCSFLLQRKKRSRGKEVRRHCSNKIRAITAACQWTRLKINSKTEILSDGDHSAARSNLSVENIVWCLFSAHNHIFGLPF